MSENKTKKPKRWILPVVASVLILALLGGGIWYFFFRENDDSSEKSDEDEYHRLYADYFTFLQTAFPCGQGETPTLVIAEFYDEDEDLSNLVLCAYCKETGEEIEMTDDGKGADTIAGDHAFYGKTSFSFEEETTLTFTLRAKQSKYKISADKAKVTSYTRESYNRSLDLQYEITRRLDELASTVNQNIATKEDAEAYNQAAEQMEEYLKSLQAEGQISSYSFDFPYFIINLPLTSFAYSFGQIEGLQSGAGDAPSGGSVKEQVFEDAAQEMVSIYPFEGELPSSDFDEAVRSITSASLGYKLTKTYRTGDMNADVLKKLHTYRVITINSHGGYSSDTGSFISINVPMSEISESDRTSLRIIPSTKDRALVTPAYFENYYGDGSLNNCLIYIGTCHGADDDQLQRVLIRKGARAVLAFKNSVYTDYDGSMVKSIYKALTFEDSKASNKTVPVTDALEAAQLVNGEEDPTNREFFRLIFGGYNDNPAKLKLFQAQASNPFRLSDDIDGGTISGSVISAVGNQPIFLARIQLEKDGNTRTTYTQADGTFTYSLSEGDYKVTVSADGYHPLIYNCKVHRNQTTYLETMLLLEQTESEYGTAQGFVTSALTGKMLPDVKLTLRHYWNNVTEGDLVAHLKTDENGEFKIDLPVGYYTALAEKDGYVSSSFNVIVSSKVTNSQTYSLNKILGENEYRIVLTWDADPSDLDLHLSGPRSTGGSFEVYYKFMNYTENGESICLLDVDDTSSYGPETVTLMVLDEDQPYYCFVHHYRGNGSLTTSSARLDVYNGSKMLGTFFVPSTTETGIYWNAFAIKNGKIITKNTITSRPDVSYANE